MDGRCGIFASAGGKDDGRGAGNSIATGVNPFAAGLAAVFTHNDPAPLFVFIFLVFSV